MMYKLHNATNLFFVVSELPEKEILRYYNNQQLSIANNLNIPFKELYIEETTKNEICDIRYGWQPIYKLSVGTWTNYSECHIDRKDL